MLFAALYFGFDKKSSKQKALETSRASQIETTGIQNLLVDAKKSIAAQDLAIIEKINSEASQDTSSTEKLIELSSYWYKLGKPVIAGYYAEEIANKKDDFEAWSIAGTTYIIGMNSEKDQKNKLFARNRAINCLEKAISLNPNDVDSQTNLALIYVEMPDKNPMQGILMLRDLNEKYPTNVGVLTQLGKLSLRTNQIDNAIKRLSQAVQVEPNNKMVNCLLVEAYSKAGNTAMAEKHNKYCIN